MRFRNYYKCPKCGHEWVDDWSATCDDDCPHCEHRHISPYKSEDQDDEWEEIVNIDVVFRKSKKLPHDVYALFPYENHSGYLVTCFDGCHSGADYYGCIRTSRPATKEEYRPLLRDLRNRGYRVRILRKASYRKMQEAREKAMSQHKPFGFAAEQKENSLATFGVYRE